MTIPAYPKILHVGDPRTSSLFADHVQITEKIDGSAFSFARIDDTLHMRSKGATVYMEDDNKMFSKAKAFAKQAFDRGVLPDGIVFHGEYLQNEKHNSLTYKRVPQGNFMLYAVRYLISGEFLPPYKNLVAWADGLGCEAVPLLYEGTMRQPDADWFRSLIDKESFLGGAKMEGCVVKNFHQRPVYGGQELPLLSAKFVSEAFKEVHKVNWTKDNLTPLEAVGKAVRSEARWRKAVYARRDAGLLEQNPRDIGPLIQAITADIFDEEKEAIKEQLFNLFRKDITRIAVRGFPEWYKQQLVDMQFSVDLAA